MDEDLIDALADVLHQQLTKATQVKIENHSMIAVLSVLDDIQAVAEVINDYQPTYDLRYFYRRAGYPEPYPEHEII
jgi:predicted ABC-class ATPase